MLQQRQQLGGRGKDGLPTLILPSASPDTQTTRRAESRYWIRPLLRNTFDAAATSPEQNWLRTKTLTSIIVSCRSNSTARPGSGNFCHRARRGPRRHGCRRLLATSHWRTTPPSLRASAASKMAFPTRERSSSAAPVSGFPQQVWWWLRSEENITVPLPLMACPVSIMDQRVHFRTAQRAILPAPKYHFSSTEKCDGLPGD